MATKAKASDYTGRLRETAANATAEAQQKATQEAATAAAEASIKAATEVVDATEPNKAFSVVVEEIKTTGATGKTVTIRVSENIESMTLGAGNYYSFTTGQKYEVTTDVADHLEAKGYLAARF